MARGWESKSVEAQQEESGRRTRSGAKQEAPEERERRDRRKTLSLARARAVADLARATTPAHRAMLERLIADLDSKLG